MFCLKNPKANFCLKFGCFALISIFLISDMGWAAEGKSFNYKETDSLSPRLQLENSDIINVFTENNTDESSFLRKIKDFGRGKLLTGALIGSIILNTILPPNSFSALQAGTIGINEVQSSMGITWQEQRDSEGNLIANAFKPALQTNIYYFGDISLQTSYNIGQDGKKLDGIKLVDSSGTVLWELAEPFDTKTVDWEEQRDSEGNLIDSGFIPTRKTKTEYFHGTTLVQTSYDIDQDGEKLVGISVVDSTSGKTLLELSPFGTEKATLKKDSYPNGIVAAQEVFEPAQQINISYIGNIEVHQIYSFDQDGKKLAGVKLVDSAGTVLWELSEPFDRNAGTWEEQRDSEGNLIADEFTPMRETKLEYFDGNILVRASYNIDQGGKKLDEIELVDFRGKPLWKLSAPFNTAGTWQELRNRNGNVVRYRISPMESNGRNANIAGETIINYSI